ncbi:MAG: carbamoyl phosphate synthase small subunit [Clostridiales bacterium]|jgi:carbamoyl-phosphate synthase small subunit|nr:carbamoyl phosphate synthase small subunit [Clostridiales bacterium]
MGYLLLANEKIFKGSLCGAGANRPVIGELVFTTQMTGFLETLTDPSYFGQIVLQTFPLVGNYGVIEEDFESAGVHLSGYIAREICDEPSNFRSSGGVAEFLKKQGKIGLTGVDTREITKIIREQGAINAAVCPEDPRKLPEEEYAGLLKEIREYSVDSPVLKATSDKIEFFAASAEYDKPFNVAFWDFGAKGGIIRSLTARGCGVTSFPAGTGAEELLRKNPDGIMLSNGPGDPKDNEPIVAEIKKAAAAKIPIFGICLGHQLLARAFGAGTEKLKYGHRGANHPVADLETGRLYITSQNHGYTVSGDTLSPKFGRVTMINDHDGTCEGITYSAAPAFSAQFHPEACAGPRDTAFLFEKFISLMKEKR